MFLPRHPFRATSAQGAVAVAALVAFPGVALASNHWVEFNNETSTRIVVSSALFHTDSEEKAYAWGDVNKNGWVDLVIGRKQPFSTAGRRVNVLLINENGVLVDRTADYATASDVPGDEGFLTPTADRGVTLVDLNDNDWLDLATGPAYGQGQPKSISHPRVYRNLANDTNGQWQGLIFENNRIPQLAQAPNTCGVSAGDVTGNGRPDLYFPTYGNTPTDHLLINDGNAFFTEETSARLNSSFHVSGFGTASHIVDLNNNGSKDIVKSEAGPVKTAYNDGNGFFSTNNTPTSAAHYHVAVGDLNKNGRMDLVIVDDGQDRVRLNLSTNTNGTVNWSSNLMLPESSCGSGGLCTGFGGNAYTVDLNNNGWLDIVIADVDIDISGCNRHANIYRSNANGDNLAFTYDIANIPSSMLQGTYDFGLLDITGNGWIDLVVGRCNTSQIWINQPPFNLQFAYPNGLPATLEPAEVTPVAVQLVAVGGEITPGSARVHYAVNGGSFSEQALTHVGDDLYTAELPEIECLDEIAFYFTADVGGTEFKHPAGAPNDVHTAVAFGDLLLVDHVDFDGNVSDWSVEGNPTMGAWHVAEPTGALQGSAIAAPFGASVGTNAFVTCSGCIGTNCVNLSCKVMDGPTDLLSPTYDLLGGDGVITYDRWMYSRLGNDFLRTWLSNDGGTTWVLVHETNGTNFDWQTTSFVVSDHLTPTDQVQVKFSINNASPTATTNAGIDNFNVDLIDCGDEPPPPCPGDLTGSGVVNVFDLLDLLGAWGANPGHPADINGDGVVNVFDLLELLANWGPCPS